MKLIAKKPCSFGGRKFYIGDEIPENLVTDARMQEKMGVITIANDMGVVSVTGSGIIKDVKAIPQGTGTLYTQEELERMVAEAVDEAVNNTVAEMQQKQEELLKYTAELREIPPEAFVGTFMVPVKTEDNENGNAQYISLPMTPEGVAQVVSVMQSKANEGIEMVSDITDENVLILIHALDSRVTVKNAAKKQAGTLNNTEPDKNDAQDGNTVTEPPAADGNTKAEDGVIPQDGDGK